MALQTLAPVEDLKGSDPAEWPEKFKQQYPKFWPLVTSDAVEIEMVPGQKFVVTSTEAAQMVNAKFQQLAKKQAAMYAATQFYAPSAIVPEIDVRRALVNAKERLAKYGWLRGNWGEPGKSPICLGQALNMKERFGHQTPAEHEAIRRVAHRISGGGNGSSIPSWNDSPERKESEINAVLDDLIAEAATKILREEVAAVTA